MKILWLSNIIMPEASKLWNEKPTPFGGWLVHASLMLANADDVSLSIAFPKSDLEEVTYIQGESIHYIGFPATSNRTMDTSHFLREILNREKPDIVHIYGTEYKHSNDMVKLCLQMKIKSVTSIQGLVSVYASHYTANLPARIQTRHTLRDFLKNDNILKQKEKFEQRGQIEIETIKLSQHIIGRTQWDYACTREIHPQSVYHHCYETLRASFYHHSWQLESCEPYAIFASQSYYPIKGIHMLFEALSYVIKEYPTTKLYISGENLFEVRHLKDALRMSSYARYIHALIRRYHLHDHIVFTGILDEEKMVERYLKSHVFVLPSSIENSPNSIGEAMILGVPTVASYVGGVMDFISHDQDGYLYPFDAPYMLAYYIKRIFADPEIANLLSSNAQKNAHRIHDPETNVIQLLSIYQKIIFN